MTEREQTDIQPDDAVPDDVAPDEHEQALPPEPDEDHVVEETA